MRVDEKETAIITYVDRNNEENIKEDFLKSLFEISCYEGYVFILDYGMSDDIRKEIEEVYPVKILKSEKKIDIFVDRYKDIFRVIDSLPQTVISIATMDSGDIWFQEGLGELFEFAGKSIKTVVENRVWDEDEWSLKCINSLDARDKKMVLGVLSKTLVRNSGVIVGNRELMRDVFQNVYEDIVRCGYSFFGIDQIFVNYEIAKLNSEKRRALEDRFNYVLVSNKGDFELKDNIVYKKNGELIVVVHNAGGNWRVLDRPFLNKWSNPEQYKIERITRFKKEGGMAE